MRIPLIILFTCALLVGCSSPLLPAQVNSPFPTVVSDDLGIYREALTLSSQQDLTLLDHPTRYDLVLTYSASPPTLTGSEEVLYTNCQSVPLSDIYFRLFANYPESGGHIQVTALDVDRKKIVPELQVQDTALRVPLEQPLGPGASTVVHMEFSILIPENSRHYADFLASGSVVTMPTVYPLIPAYDAEGWHLELPPSYGDLVYADASLYIVELTVPSEMNIIASGSSISNRENSDGTKTAKLVGAPMRDFDINLSTVLQSSSQVVGETTITSWYEPSDAQSGMNALKYAADALGIFQKRFGAYPYRELDIVETPTTAGGIEYPGIVVVGRSLYEDARSRTFFEFATVHEVSHQWWYAVVGDDQVNYPWVDEALAQYSTLLYQEDIHGSNAARSVLVDYFQGLYERAKREGRDAAVNQPVGAFSEDDYGSIVYGKAPLFYDAIRQKMGDEKFNRFLSSYYQSFRYRIAFPENVLGTAEAACECSLAEEYRQWITGP